MCIEFFNVLPLIICIFWVLFILLNKYYNRAFSLLVLIYLDIFFILSYFAHYIYSQHSLNCFFYTLSILAALTYYPLLYVYILLLISNPEWKSLLKKSLMAPIGLSILSISVFCFIPYEELDKFMINTIELINLFHTFSVFGKIGIVLFYINIAFFYYEIIFFTYKIIRRLKVFDYDMKKHYLSLKKKMPKFTNILLYLIIVSSLLNTCIFLKLFLSPSNSILFIVISSVLCCLFLFLLGISSLKEFNFLEDVIDEVEVDKINIVINNDNIKKGYSYNSLHLRRDLLELFNTKAVYKNPDLRVSDIAYSLNTNRTYVSDLINNNIGSNFSDFVNEFRVIHAKEMLSNPEYEHLTLSEIAEQSGFSSNNSFYRSFKKFAKTSPNLYRIEKLYSIYHKK